jgi:AGCS family alanine or glycine:cation symporter
MDPSGFDRLVVRAADIVWGPWTIGLLFSTAVFVSVRTRFVQLRRFREALSSVAAPSASARTGVLTTFQAFATALSASIGTGNVAGVATAIVSGGPGAVFWIWCYGLLSMAVKFSEASLGVAYRRVRPDGGVSTGPMYYLEDGIGAKSLAKTYALLAGVAAILTTPFTQPNSIALVVHAWAGVPRLWTGIVLAVLTWIVVIGGLRAIGRVAERLAPLKVGLYLAGGLVVIAAHADRLPSVLALIVTEAFAPRSLGGGVAGIGMMSAMRYGLARGVMASEAGYGTAAVAFGAARSSTPTLQGLNAVTEVFVICFVTSSVSALTILVADVWQSGLTSTALVAQAFETAIPGGGWLVVLCSFLFGYTTLIGWAYYGEQFLEYLTGARIAIPYRWLYCALIPFGASLRVETVWAWGDLLNGLQLFPNLVAIVLLAPVVAQFARAPLAAGREARSAADSRLERRPI